MEQWAPLVSFYHTEVKGKPTNVTTLDSYKIPKTVNEKPSIQSDQVKPRPKAPEAVKKGAPKASELNTIKNGAPSVGCQKRKKSFPMSIAKTAKESHGSVTVTREESVPLSHK